MDKRAAWRIFTDFFDADIPSELGPRRFVVAAAVAVVVAIGIVLRGMWNWYAANVSAITPLGTFIGAAIVAWAALAQAKTARLRHEEQTKADLQRRITESFAKAAEQLASDKLAVRLAGIYTMERVARESWKDYLPVMETLSAFARERPHLAEVEHKMATDVCAVIAVIGHRTSEALEYERKNRFTFDLSNADLRGAELDGIELHSANLVGTNFQGAVFWGGNLSFAKLKRANLSRCGFFNLRLTSADLSGANLRGISGNNSRLINLNLDSADLTDARFNNVTFGPVRMVKTIVRGADLRRTNLMLDDIENAIGDESTQLPAGVQRPTHWASSN